LLVGLSHMQTSINEIKTLEQKVFDSKTIDNLPFDFFNYFAQVIVNPDKFEIINIPENVENYFRVYKTRDGANLFQLLRKSGISLKATSFTKSYAYLFMLRYQQAFKRYARYSLRRIQTPEEYGLLYKFGVKNAPQKQYIAFDVDRFIPKFENGALDIIKLIETEKIEKNIASYFSTITTLPNLSPLLLTEFTNITTCGFLPIVYKKEFEDLIIELTFQVLFYFSKLVYEYLEKETPLTEIIGNLIAYYAQTVNPDSFKFSLDLENLESLIKEVLINQIKTMTMLSKKNKEILLYELIEVVLRFIQSGFTLPSFYYFTKIRNASEFDKNEYRIKYVCDLYLYDELGRKGKTVFESYGFVVNEDALEKILKEAFGNAQLYNKFISLD